MTVLDILQIGHPTLRRSAGALKPDQIASPKWQGFIDDLLATMSAANGAGLAANQVGEAVRICAVQVRANNPRYPYKPEIPLTVLINPVITPVGDVTFANYEGCLSVPDLRGVVPRHEHIQVDYLDRNGDPQSREERGISAGTFQHELDHLDGLLFVDRVQDPKTLCTWANFEAHHKEAWLQEVLAMQRRLGLL
jgi:peptide deformylase